MPGQYFEAQPTVGSRPGTVRLDLADLHVELRVDRGVFAAGRVDAGTMALLRALPTLPPGALLDLGCGYGPIACTLASRQPGAQVWATDVNERALALTAANAAELGVDIHAVAPGAVPADLRFAAIVSNPPIRVGKDALHDLLGTWLPRLDDGGEAWLVVQRHLGADSLSAWMEAGGWRVERRASKQGYRILRVTRPAEGRA
jgi:16S rRNA (guanine1207-N2)-methyltransferase